MFTFCLTVPNEEEIFQNISTKAWSYISIPNPQSMAKFLQQHESMTPGFPVNSGWETLCPRSQQKAETHPEKRLPNSKLFHSFLKWNPCNSGWDWLQCFYSALSLSLPSDLSMVYIPVPPFWFSQQLRLQTKRELWTLASLFLVPHANHYPTLARQVHGRLRQAKDSTLEKCISGWFLYMDCPRFGWGWVEWMWISPLAANWV